jgi:cysteine desulfurase
LIYLDHHATTPVAPEVVEVMISALSELGGNPGSVHTPGRAARAAVDQARRKLAELVGSREREVVFTSGGTEANNLALRAAWTVQAPLGRRRILSSTVEHPSVLNTLKALEAEGAEVIMIPVSSEGALDQAAFDAALNEDVALVSLMYANNETGVIFPVAELGQRAQRVGALMHVDAIQVVGRLPVQFAELPVDLMSLSAHKLRGPKGVGALILRKGLDLKAVQTGGNQERGMRSGTENTAGIVGLGRAAELALQSLTENAERHAALRDEFEAMVLDRVTGVRVNGLGQRRLPTVTNLEFADLEGEAALLALDMKGICASSGSACASGSLEPSHVLLAMGRSAEQAHGSIRFSLGSGIDRNDLMRVVDVLTEQVPKLRALLSHPINISF